MHLRVRQLVPVLVVLLSFGGLARASTHWVQNGVTTVANSGSGGEGQMKAVSDGAGGAIITWRDFRSLAAGDIYAQRIDEYGHELWNAGGIPICGVTGDQIDPMIAASERRRDGHI